MKSLFYCLFFLSLPHLVRADAGIFEGGMTIGGINYWHPNSGGGFSFHNQNLSVVQGGTLSLTYAYQKTWKNSGADVCSARMYYCVYPASGSCGSFSTVNLPTVTNINDASQCSNNPPTCDQQWNTSGSFSAINLASGLAPGNYKIAVYFDATTGNHNTSCSGNPGTAYLSNGGSNYIANLTVTVPAPVGLVAFDAKARDAQVALAWATATEYEHDYFAVERLELRGNWKELGQIKGKGNSVVQNDYTFTDRKPLAGTNYYRLRIVDLRGGVEYSPVAQAQGSVGGGWQVAPNPASDRLIVRALEKDAPEAATLRLFNAQGTLVLERSWTSGLEVPLSGLSAGQYWLEIQPEDNQVPVHLPVVKH